MSRQGLVADHSGATARPSEAFATHPCAVDGEGLVGFSRRSNASTFSGLEAFAKFNFIARCCYCQLQQQMAGTEMCKVGKDGTGHSYLDGICPQAFRWGSWVDVDSVMQKALRVLKPQV